MIAIRLGPEDRVVSMTIPGDNEEVLLFVSEKGYAKRTKVSDFRVQSRGGKGIIGMRTSPKIGGLVGVRVVEPDDEIVVMTSEGVILRTKIDTISIIGRATQGVRLMRLRPGHRISGLALIPQEDQDESNEGLFDEAEGSKEPTLPLEDPTALPDDIPDDEPDDEPEEEPTEQDIEE